MRRTRRTGGLNTGMAGLVLFVASTSSLRAAANGSFSGTLTDPIRVGSHLVPNNLLLFAQGITQLSGTVVDTSGAVIAGATVQLRSANGTVQATTQSDTNGSFIISGTISGLTAGNYRLVVSNPGFETKEIPVTIGTTEAGPAAHLSGRELGEHHRKRAGP
jgi:hypothetical protein